MHLGFLLATVAAAIHVVTRAAGLADLGWRNDLSECFIRHGKGDPKLAEAIRRDADFETSSRRIVPGLPVWYCPREIIWEIQLHP